MDDSLQEIGLGSRWSTTLGSSARSRLAPYLESLLKIAEVAAGLTSLEDHELRALAKTTRDAVLSGGPVENLVASWFALVGEVARRTIGQQPFESQVVAGLALLEGRLVEMNTGEGKTLAAVAPASLSALRGHGLHVLTFNDYLAERDARWMEPIYRELGLSVSFVTAGTPPTQRALAYRSDVTYVTVKEAGFDLLRDGLCFDPSDQVHRPFHAALVDEADSILIDEARIPLVIAGSWDDSRGELEHLAVIARELDPSLHFDVDEHQRNIFLTDEGVQSVERRLGCANLFDPGHSRLQAEIRNALHAEALLHRDVDYIVRDDRIELVDELTGRVAENRHWPDGLQAAMEAKEGLHPQPEGRVLSSIAIQHLLHRYPHLAGMTGTATSAADELSRIYDLDVVTIPSNRPCIRRDHSDCIYLTKAAKRRALIEEISRVTATGRPILVGTASVEESDSLATALLEAGITCRVLNARNDAEEAEIVAEAGALGAVTISTNMAGRGTDIRLGGSLEHERRAVVELGGLYVIGTNRHESRRIDDQLRGRSGRQGDPGSSRFFISLEDELLEKCGIRGLVPRRLLPEGEHSEAVEHPAVQREIERSQRIIEGQHGDIRSRLLEYSQLIESQRNDLYETRQAVLLDPGKAEGLLRLQPELHARLLQSLGRDGFRGVARRVVLLTIDSLWRDHLERAEALRDEVLWVQYDGRQPLVEFYRAAGSAYDDLTDAIRERAIETLVHLETGPDGVDWEQDGLRGPNSTWTYLVNDSVFGDSTFLTLATRPGLGMWAVIACWWLLLPWAAAIHWKRWRERIKSRGDDASMAGTGTTSDES